MLLPYYHSSQSLSSSILLRYLSAEQKWWIKASYQHNCKSTPFYYSFNVSLDTGQINFLDAGKINLFTLIIFKV